MTTFIYFYWLKTFLYICLSITTNFIEIGQVVQEELRNGRSNIIYRMNEVDCLNFTLLSNFIQTLPIIVFFHSDFFRKINDNIQALYIFLFVTDGIVEGFFLLQVVHFLICFFFFFSVCKFIAIYGFFSSAESIRTN